MADKSLDIEEINKVRLSLGMPALPTSNGTSKNLNTPPSHRNKRKSVSPRSSDSEGSENDAAGSTLESRQAAASDNWQKLQAEKNAEEARREKRANLKKAREAAQRFTKLSGKGLGDAAEADMDTRSWLLQSNKRQKKIQKERARRLEQQLAEQENQAQYTEKDLEGVKVGHDVGEFEDGEQILTLKDAAVDEEDGEDELENTGVREKESRNERLQLKKKRQVYDPNEADETGQHSILGQYDEEIDGKKKKQFKLNKTGSIEAAPIRAEDNEEVDSGSGPRKVKISLDFAKDDKPSSDYQNISEIKIKKPKKKKDKSKRQKAADEDMFTPDESVTQTKMDSDAMDLDSKPGRPVPQKRSLQETSFIDDDDLQSSLAQQRRAAFKKRKTARPEDLAKQVREEGSETPDTAMNGTEEAEEGGLVIDETTEFVSNLQKPEPPKRHTSNQSKRPTSPVPKKEESPDADEDGDMDIDRAYNEFNASPLKRSTSPSSKPRSSDVPATGLEEEATLNQGMGSTLTMLTQRGILKSAAPGGLNAEYRERQRFLTEKQNREAAMEAKARAQRERDRASGKFERMSGKEREAYAQRENQSRDQQDSRAMADVFNREYRPNVDLKYVDEHGRYMGQKEAFRFLSHQFHGKGSGKGKTEKKLKKIEEERKQEAASSLDSSQSTGMDRAARNYKQAGVRLQ